MTLSKSVLEIVNDPNPGVTAVRKHSKEVIVTALLEMKRIFSEQALEIRRIDLEMARMNFELKKMEMDHKIKVSEGILTYGSETKEHRYGPKYSSEISSNLSAMWMGNEDGTSTLTKPEDNELEQRVEAARSQGMRWNLQDKRPERNSTVIRKLNDWESAVDRGLKADLDLYTQHDHKKLMEMDDVCKGFVVGLCMQMEQKMGIGPSSVYLAPRYKRDAEKYRELFTSQVPVVPPVPTISPEDNAKAIVTKIYTAWLGSDYRAKIKAKDEEEGNRTPGLPAIKNYIEKHTQMIVDMDPEDSIRDRSFATEVLWNLTQPFTLKLIKENLDWGGLCGRDPEYVDYSDIYRGYKLTPGRKQVFDDAFEGWWTEMCEREGL
jgi:hypothetical protein